MSKHDGPATCNVRLRVYYEFEKPRNGRQVILENAVLTENQPVCKAFDVWQAIQTLLDSDRFVPHVYQETADCFVQIENSSDQLITAEVPSEQGQLHHIDVKLVSRTDSGRASGNLAQRIVCDSSLTCLTGSWFGIGIVRGKTASNHGSLWRSALQFGAAMTFTIGKRYEKKIEGSADIYKTYRQIPCLAYENVGNFMASVPVDTQIVAVEYGGTNLTEFKHPKRALYVLGSEDMGIPPALVQFAHAHVSIPTAEGRPSSLNVAAAGAVIMYDRQLKEIQAKQAVKLHE